MSNKVFDANKELKKNLDKVMDTVGTNGICIPLAAAYTSLIKQVNTIIAPAAMFKKQIVDNADKLTTDVFNELSSTLNILSSNIPDLSKMTIDSKTLLEANIFKKTCLDFNDILPNAMTNLITDGISKVNELAGDVMSEIGSFVSDIGEDIYDFGEDIYNDIDEYMGDTEFDFPDEINDMINYSVDFFKDNALSDALSDITKDALSPLTMYRDFIKSTGIIEMLKRLQKFEKCMTNPKNCNRPKSEFYFPGTKKYNSQYYMELLSINLKGELQLKKLTKQVKGIETKLSKTMKNLNSFDSKQLIKK